MRALILGALVLGLLASAAPARDRALVVGVNLYPGITVNGAGGGRNLRGPVVDARTFETLLVENFGFEPSDIKVLLDGQATRDGILDAFRSWLIDGTGPGDQAVFFFAGHGLSAVVTDATGGKRLTSGIVPSDASGEVAADAPAFKGTILGPEIDGLLRRIADRRVMVFADSCQSGSVTRDLAGRPVEDASGIRTLTPHAPANLSARDITPDLSRQAKVEGRLLKVAEGPAVGSRVVWHAATLAQVTFDDPGRPGGVFTQSFADGLRGKAAIPGRGIVTVSSLRDYVQAEATRICRGLGARCSEGLTPGVDAPADYLAAVLAPRAPPPAPPEPGDAAALKADALLTHVNDFALKLEILPGAVLRRGQQMRFKVTSAEGGHLVLLDAGADGTFTQIFPNPISEAAHKGASVAPGAPITIPDASYGFAFTAKDRGRGSLIAVAAERAVDLPSIVQAAQGLAPVSDRLLTVTAAKLQAPVLSPDPNVPNRAARWAFERVPYRVD